MMDPGRLKTRLLLQAPVQSDDGQGGVVRSYATQAIVWAAVTPLGGGQSGAAGRSSEAGAEGAVARYRITLRGNFNITLQHRLVDGDRTYRIVGLRDRDERRFVEIDVEWRVE